MKPRQQRWVIKLSLLGGVLLAAAGWGAWPVMAALAATGSTGWRWVLPAGFPEPAVPPDNPMRAAKVDLGRHLFYDKRLSGNGSLACAGCHLQALAFTDGQALATGATGEHTPRSSQHLGNVAYSPTLTWANPSLLSLERQMEVPLFGDNPVEMGVNDSNKAQVLQRFKDDPLYRQKFTAAFATAQDAVSWENAIKAIASFQRTLLSGNSRYDQFKAGKTALSATERRGMDLFFGERAKCHHCHGSFNFNDQAVDASTRVLAKPFHNTGLYNIDGKGAFPEPNRGVFELSGQPKDMGAFRAPSLRNVALTAPYMHDGSIPTLEGVLDFYTDGGRHITSGPEQGDGRRSPYKSALIALIELNIQDKQDIVAFLKTLTDHEFLVNPTLSDPFKAQ